MGERAGWTSLQVVLACVRGWWACECVSASVVGPARDVAVGAGWDGMSIDGDM